MSWTVFYRNSPEVRGLLDWVRVQLKEMSLAEGEDPEVSFGYPLGYPGWKSLSLRWREGQEGKRMEMQRRLMGSIFSDVVCSNPVIL